MRYGHHGVHSHRCFGNTLGVLQPHVSDFYVKGIELVRPWGRPKTIAQHLMTLREQLFR